MAKRTRPRCQSARTFPLVWRLLGTLAIFFPASPAHAATIASDGTVMVRICSEGGIRYVPFPAGTKEDTPGAPVAAGCHAPCLVEKKKPGDGLRRSGPAG